MGKTIGWKQPRRNGPEASKQDRSQGLDGVVFRWKRALRRKAVTTSIHEPLPNPDALLRNSSHSV